MACIRRHDSLRHVKKRARKKKIHHLDTVLKNVLRIPLVVVYLVRWARDTNTRKSEQLTEQMEIATETYRDG